MGTGRPLRFMLRIGQSDVFPGSWRRMGNIMKEIFIEEEGSITREQLENVMREMAEQFPEAKKVLIVPPDFTRCYSCAGEITQILYRVFAGRGALVHVIPALGTHMPMSAEEKEAFFAGVVPEENFLVHHWQTDTVKLGTVPSEVVSEISGGLFRQEIDVEVNHLLVDGGYDLVLSVGQVVPHEVVGMANYSKNLFVGLGGRSMINESHMLSAVCGMEKALGVVDSPARKVYDYAQKHYIDGKIPVVFLQTVTVQEDGGTVLKGCFIGESRKPFERAAVLSQKLNIVHVGRRAKKVVTYLDPKELKTTWVGNKGIYRTRMIVEDGGELVVMAPGVIAFGENEEMDRMTRRFGYKGRDYILKLYEEGAFEGRVMSAAHLIQGSSDGRFTITYATRPENLSKEEVESVGFRWADYEETARRYPPETLKDGWHTGEDGEEFYYVGTPAAGLWKAD